MCRSIIRSLGIIFALAACEASPNILIHATRPDSSVPLFLLVCGESGCNSTRQIFGPADPLAKSVGIYRKDASKSLSLEFTHGSGGDVLCESFDVSLEGGDVELTARIGSGGAPMNIECSASCSTATVCPVRE